VLAVLHLLCVEQSDVSQLVSLLRQGLVVIGVFEVYDLVKFTRFVIPQWKSFVLFDETLAHESL